MAQPVCNLTPYRSMYGWSLRDAGGKQYAFINVRPKRDGSIATLIMTDGSGSPIVRKSFNGELDADKVVELFTPELKDFLR